MKISSFFESKIDCYKSIDDLPKYNWDKINESNDYSWLLKKKFKLNDKQKKYLGGIWENILAEFIDTFGIPEKMKEILELKREIFVLKCQLHLDGDKLLKNFINVAEFKLRKLIEKDKGQTTGQVKVYVEKYLGFKLNEKETTVREFFEYIEVLKQQAKQNIRVNGQ